MPADTAEDALRWIADVARGMSYLHTQPGIRIAHRDLKLENILLSGGIAKVADFGLSRLIVGEEVSASSGDHPAGTGDSSGPTGTTPSVAEQGTPAGLGGWFSPLLGSLSPLKAVTTGALPSSDAASGEASTVMPGDGGGNHPDMTGKTGSLRYMAPEVWNEEEYSHKVSISCTTPSLCFTHNSSLSP